MTKHVYFSAHADNPLFNERSHALLDANWPILRSGEAGRDLKILSPLYEALIGLPMHEDIIAVWDNQDVSASEHLRTSGLVMMSYAAFGEALYRWSTTQVLNVMFQEQHAYALDSQMRFFELTKDKALFFALQHVALSDFCEAQMDPGRFQLREVNLRGTGRPVTLGDILGPVLESMTTRLAASKDPVSRLKTAAQELFYGAEILMSIA